ncbi:hypothetical protein, partial [Peribacillus cavernae]
NAENDAQADANSDNEANNDANAENDAQADANVDNEANNDANAENDAQADANADNEANNDANAENDAQADANADASAGGNTFTNGNNTIINYSDNSGALIGMVLSTLTMMEVLRGDRNSNNNEALISNLTNTLSGMLQGENNNRKVILDAINSLKKEDK